MTVAQYLAAALVRNKKTQEAAEISETGAEVVSAFNRALAGYFTIAARVNPSYFGSTADVTPNAGFYARPADAELVYLIRDSEGAKVHRVPVEEPDAELGPRVMRWGRGYTAVAASVAGDLTMWYSRRPTPASALASNVDPVWDEHFADLGVVELAAWLAHRDERYDEKAALLAERDHWLRIFLASLGHESVGETRETGHAGLFVAPNLQELQGLLLMASAG